LQQVFGGVDNDGSCPCDATVNKVLALDPAVLTDKVAKYTGVQFDDFTISPIDDLWATPMNT